MTLRALPGLLIACCLLAPAAALTGCATPEGETLAQRREDVRRMARRTVDEMKTQHPELSQKLATAPGYAVFREFGGQIVVIGGANGYGLVHDNSTGRDHFMRIADLDLGLGLGGRSERAVMVFNDPDTLRSFIWDGWKFGGQAEAIAKVDRKGGAAEAKGVVQPIEVYTISDTGLIARATLSGAKAWRDEDLNIDPPGGMKP